MNTLIVLSGKSKRVYQPRHIFYTQCSGTAAIQGK